MRQKKNRLLCMSLAALMVVFTFSGKLMAQAPPGRTRIGVVSFENKSQLQRGDTVTQIGRDDATRSNDNAYDGIRGGARVTYDVFGSGMADILVSELIKNRNYDMFERAQLDKAFAEMSLGASGAFETSTVAQIGKAQGIKYIVLGTIIEASIKSGGVAVKGFGAGSATTTVVVNVRVVEVETGRIVLSEVGEGTTSAGAVSTPDASVGGSTSFGAYSASARDAIAKVALVIRDNIDPVEAMVALVKLPSNEVTIDMGRESGIREKQRYLILRDDGPIIVNGKELGRETTTVAEITIKRVEANLSIGNIDKRHKEKIEYVPGKYRDEVIPINVGYIVRPIGAKDGKKGLLPF